MNEIWGYHFKKGWTHEHNFLAAYSTLHNKEDIYLRLLRRLDILGSMESIK